MEEIAQQFKEELQELLDRYKDKMSTPQIMHIAQPIFTKTIGFKDNPERFPTNELDRKMKRCFSSEWRNIDELEGSAGRDAVAGVRNES